MQERDVKQRKNIRGEHVRIVVGNNNENTVINVKGENVQVGDNNVMCVLTMGYPASADINQMPDVNRATILRVVNSPEAPICVGRLTWNNFPTNEDHVFTLAADTRNFDRRDREYFLVPSVTLCKQGEKSTEQVASFQVDPKQSAILNSETSFVFRFRFHDRPAQLSVTFALEMCTQVGFLKKNKKRQILDEVTVRIDTVVKKQKRLKKRKDHCNICCEGDISEWRPYLSARLQKRLPQAELSNESRKLSGISDFMLEKLHPVRDDGHWETFEMIAKDLEVKFPHEHSQITLQLERSEADCFQGKLERADKTLQEVLRTLEKEPGIVNANRLYSSACFKIAEVHRRQNRLGSAMSFIELGEQALTSVGATMETGFLAYAKAATLFMFMGNQQDRSPAQVEIAKELFERSVEIRLELKKRQEPSLYVKDAQFVVTEFALLLLDCQTTNGRQRTVPDRYIREAKSRLDQLSDNKTSWEAMTNGAKVQFNIARSDQFFRMNSYRRAEEFAKEALRLANEQGFNTEARKIEDRLDAIQECIFITEVKKEHQLCLDTSDEKSSWKETDSCQDFE